MKKKAIEITVAELDELYGSKVQISILNDNETKIIKQVKGVVIIIAQADNPPFLPVHFVMTLDTGGTTSFNFLDKIIVEIING